MQSTGKPSDPLSKFSLSIFRANGLLMRNGDLITGSIGQSSARWQVLGRVGYQAQTVAHIARDMGYARQSVQRIADILVKEGLALYKDNPKDKRAQLMELTPKGLGILMSIYKVYGEWSEKIMRKLSAKQLNEIADSLEAVSNVIEKNVNERTEGGEL